MKTTLLVRLAIAASAAASAHAIADAGMRHEAGFTNVQLGVIDLTPNDGNAASFAVGTVRTTHWLSIDSAETDNEDIFLYETVTGPGPSAYHAAFRSGEAATTVSGAGQFSATASAGPELGPYGHASSWISQDITVTLAAHAVLTFTGDFYRSAVLANPADSSYGAYAVEVVSASGNNNYWDLSEYDLVTLPGQPQTDSFWYAIANTSDSATTVDLTLKASAGVRMPDSLPAVPEPSTYAMLLAGLGVAGIATRRRRT